MTVTPIGTLERRAPEAGRIRLGVKTERAMKSIDTFRFTSPYEDLIRQLADLYGGVPKPWSDTRARVQNQWEVVTESKEINAYLPPGALSQQYELWAGGGRQRACDGLTCEIADRDGTVETPCICVAKGVAECKLHTRLNVVLPELPFRGMWRLETKGWNAGHEMPGMFEMVQALHAAGNMVESRITLEARSDTKGKQKRHYVVPIITVVQSPQVMLAGGGGVQGISAGSTAALPSGTSETDIPSTDPDDDIIEAEVVEPTEEELEVIDLLVGDAVQFDLDPDRYVAAVRRQAKNDLGRMRQAHEKVVDGSLEPLGFHSNGRIDWFLKEDA